MYHNRKRTLLIIAIFFCAVAEALSDQPKTHPHTPTRRNEDPSLQTHTQIPPFHEQEPSQTASTHPHEQEPSQTASTHPHAVLTDSDTLIDDSKKTDPVIPDPDPAQGEVTSHFRESESDKAFDGIVHEELDNNKVEPVGEGRRDKLDGSTQQGQVEEVGLGTEDDDGGDEDMEDSGYQPQELPTDSRDSPSELPSAHVAEKRAPSSQEFAAKQPDTLSSGRAGGDQETKKEGELEQDHHVTEIRSPDPQNQNSAGGDSKVDLRGGIEHIHVVQEEMVDLEGGDEDQLMDKELAGESEVIDPDEQSERKESEPAQEIYAKGIDLVKKLDLTEKKRGYALLQEAAEQGNTKAFEDLAYGYLFGNVLERNFTRAFELFQVLASAGNPAGQQGLGFMYSAGIGVKANQAKAILYYTFAALGGHYYAQMAMGYRALLEINVVQSCESALSYYYKAAAKVASEVTILTGGQAIVKARLMEEDDEDTNQYGVSEDDMMHYHSVFADSGNTGAQLLLGVFYMYGMAGAERNFQTALRFLHQAAEEGMPAANVLIGKIYAEGGLDVAQNNETAMRYFQKAADQKHPDGHSGVGMMYLNGMGVEQDYTKAFKSFQKAADKGSVEGQYYTAYMHLHGYGAKKDVSKALNYFQLAAHGGNLLAVYNLAVMHAEGIGTRRDCNYAAEMFKNVAERGKWTNLFVEAHRTYTAGELDSALMMYLLLSELGYEVAQSNVAFILEQEDVTTVSKNETLKRALVLWNRSAAQGYSEARVKLGDYFYYGQGTEVNFEAAAGQYRMASDKQSSAQAMFNLAYMYEQGLGLEKDYHLAKRYYDLAAETSSEALVPVNLALLKLNLVYCYEEYYKSVDLSAVTEKLDSVFGDKWDIYLISALTGLVVVVLIWRRY